MPAKLMYSPSFKHSSAVAAVPVKECMTPRSGPRSRAVASMATTSASLSRVWTMNGRFRSLSQPEVPVEIILLHGKWRVIPVAIEPRFADGHDLGDVRQCDDLLPISRCCLGTIVGLNSDRGEDRGMFGRQPDRGGAGSGGDAYGNDGFHAGGDCSGDHFRAIGVEFFLIEMGVSVDERHGGWSDFTADARTAKKPRDGRLWAFSAMSVRL